MSEASDVITLGKELATLQRMFRRVQALAPDEVQPMQLEQLQTQMEDLQLQLEDLRMRVEQKTSRPSTLMLFERVTPREQAHRLLDFWALFLPARIAAEDLGDYFEDINRRALSGQRWLLALRVAAAIFWTGVAAVDYNFKHLRKKLAA